MLDPWVHDEVRTNNLTDEKVKRKKWLDSTPVLLCIYFTALLILLGCIVYSATPNPNNKENCNVNQLSEK